MKKQMKHSMRNTWGLLLVLLITVSTFFGCGAAKSEAYDVAAAEAPMAEPEMANGAYAYDGEYEMVTEESVADYVAAAGGSTSVSGQTQKLIQNIYIDMIVTHPGEAMDQIAKYAQSTGGYLLSSENYYDEEDNTGGAYLCVRIPTGTSDQFKEYLGQMGKIETSSSDSQDVTSTYYDLQTRIEQGKKEIGKLTELLDRCETVEEMLLVREQLASVQANVESMQGEFKRLSELTSFDTVNVQLNPVRNLVQPDTDGRFMTGSELWNGIVRGLKDGVRAIINGGGQFLIFLAGVILPLSLIAAVCFGIFLLIRSMVRRSKKRRMARIQKAQEARAKAQAQAQENK